MSEGSRRGRVFGAQRRNEIVAMIEAHGVVRIAEIVSEFGVSRKTALRDLDLLDTEGRADKVHGGAVAVVPTPATISKPATLPKPATGTSADGDLGLGLGIGMVLPVRGHHNRAILRGVESVLGSRGAALSVSLTGWTPPDDGGREIEDLIGAGVAGVLVRPAPAVDRLPREVRSWIERPEVPTVLLEDEPTPAEHSAVWSVGTDDRRGVAAAVRHLQDLGHRRIALVTDGHAPRSRELHRAWQFCLQDAGLDEEVPVIDGSGFPEWPLPGAAALDEILQTFRDRQVSAVVCHNDIPALALTEHARARRWSIPGDLSVVAYEDRISTRAAAPLTTVVLPGHEVGRVAAQSLLDLIDAPGQRPRTIRIQPELVVRESTGPTATGR